MGSLYRQELLAPRWLNLAPQQLKVASRQLYTASQWKCTRSNWWYSGSMWDLKLGDPGFDSHNCTTGLTFIFSFLKSITSHLPIKMLKAFYKSTIYKGKVSIIFHTNFAKIHFLGTLNTIF